MSMAFPAPVRNSRHDTSVEKPLFDGGEGRISSHNPLRRPRLFWKLQACGWGGTCLLAIFFSKIEYFPMFETLVLGVGRTAFGFILTSTLLRLIYRWMRGLLSSLWVTAPIVFLICGIAGLADGLLVAAMASGIGMQFDQPGFGQFLVTSVFMRWMIFWLWSILYFGINYWLDTEHAQLQLAQAEAAARASELQLLRAQVNPHFLFNALNSILAESDNPNSVRALTLALAEYLRFSLQQRGDIQPLDVELEALENYLQVEKARFEEKLKYRIDASESARCVPAPVALVQPLLDNAIKYGQHSSIRPLQVTISASVDDRWLTIRVTNSGDWIDPGTLRTTGTGLANLQRRLQLLYGKEGTLMIDKNPGEVCVIVQLPMNKE